ncbi:MAG: TIGR00282 family metallophosphoesterase [Planctomycetota bacterium]
MSVRILCVGDIVGKPGRRLLADHLRGLIRDRAIDLVVCNAENAAGGSGLTPQGFSKLMHYGVDVVTMGDHVYRKREIVQTLSTSDRIVRPANLSAKAVGRRYTVVDTKNGEHPVAVTCLLGQLYMQASCSPWAAVEEVLAEIPPHVKIRVIDFHAEASSEKIAMGWLVNGRASVVFGTHTHIPTADASILDGGTAHVSDLGMTGPYDSVLGRRKERVLHFLTTNMPTPFAVADGDPRLHALLVTVDPKTGGATDIEEIVIRGYAEQPAEEEGEGQ